MARIGITIPTFNRWESTIAAFADVLADHRVDSVTIVDDASDPSDFARLAQFTTRTPKVRLCRNGQNLGMYLNKRQAMLQSLADWAVLLDSDNRIGTDYLDALFQVPEWDPKTLYIPVFAHALLDYHAFEGLAVTRQTVRDYLDEPLFLTALNTGNFFVQRYAYLTAFDESMRPFAADSLYVVYRWLSLGGRVLFTPGLHYEHSVSGGCWEQMQHESDRVVGQLVGRMRKDEWSAAHV